MSPGISAGQNPPGPEQIIINITLNQENKGEYFIYLTEDKDFLIKKNDLKTIGFADPRGTMSTIAGESYISLRSMKDVAFTLNEKILSLDIIANPELLKKEVFDFTSERPSNIYYPKDNSAFLNYGINYTSGINTSDPQAWNVTNELGLRLYDLLFLTNSTYTETKTDENFVRLQSNATYDFRKDMNRLVFGDLFASSGDLGSSLNLGGISYSRVYNINPYYIKQPLFNFSGQTTLPSEADIYVDGMLLRKEKLSPGGFELKNIQYYGGYRNVDIIIKDAFGREQKIVNPFFFNDVLLKKGLHEYSYNIGFLREDYGVQSNNYSNPAFSAFHRYGVSDASAFGFRGEGAKDIMNFGPEASFLGKDIGIFSVSVSQSIGDYAGSAGIFSHVYQSKRFSTQLMIQGNTKNYRTITNKDLTDIMKYQVNAGIGYSTREFGSLSFSYASTKQYQGIDSEIFSATYQRNLAENLQLSLSFRHMVYNEYSNEYSLRLTYYPWKDITMTLGHQRDDKSDTTSFQIQKNAPVGEGYGFRATADKNNTPDGESTFFNPFFQLNGKYGIYSGEYRGFYDKNGSTETYQFSASGGIVSVADTVGFTRPVYDSFGLVKVGEIQDVEVLQNNQRIGKTNTSGKVFIPNMGSYTDNIVAINDTNLPMNYSIGEASRRVSPPFRSGSFIKFDIAKTQGITGTLKVKTNGSIKPIEFYEITIVVDGKEIPFPTGKGGEFYIENIPPGKYSAKFNYMEKPLTFDIIIPRSDDIIIDLGSIVIENNH
jgi:outer membrane usher protein